MLKDVKSNGWPMPPGFDTFESFDHDELSANILFSGVQGLLMLMGSKFLIEMTRPQNINSVLLPGHLYFDPINIMRP